MPLMKNAPLAPATQRQRRVQTAAWTLIYGGLLVLVTGVTALQMQPNMTQSGETAAWHIGQTLVWAGSLATALGAVLIYIRSRMQK